MNNNSPEEPKVKEADLFLEAMISARGERHLEQNRIFIDAQHIIYKLKTRNKLNNLATFNIKPMNKPKGFLGQTINNILIIIIIF